MRQAGVLNVQRFKMAEHLPGQLSLSRSDGREQHGLVCFPSAVAVGEDAETDGTGLLIPALVVEQVEFILYSVRCFDRLLLVPCPVDELDVLKPLE